MRINNHGSVTLAGRNAREALGFTPGLSDGPADPDTSLLTRGGTIRDHGDAALGTMRIREERRARAARRRLLPLRTVLAHVQAGDPHPPSHLRDDVKGRVQGAADRAHVVALALRIVLPAVDVHRAHTLETRHTVRCQVVEPQVANRVPSRAFEPTPSAGRRPFRRGRGGGDCGFIIRRPAAARGRSWRRLRRGEGCQVAVAPGH